MDEQEDRSRSFEDNREKRCYGETGENKEMRTDGENEKIDKM